MIYGYIRVSTDHQTTENQRFEIKKFCEKQDIVIDCAVCECVCLVSIVSRWCDQVHIAVNYCACCECSVTIFCVNCDRACGNVGKISWFFNPKRYSCVIAFLSLFVLVSSLTHYIWLQSVGLSMLVFFCQKGQVGVVFLYFYLLFRLVLFIIGSRTLCEEHSRSVKFVSK